MQQQQPPCLPGDPSAVSLSYLAQISSEVYNSNHNSNHNSDHNATAPEGSSSGIIKVGPDRFSIYEHNVSSTSTKSSTTLFVAICGTASPLQHVMNVMPHAYRGLHFVEQALSTKDLYNNTNTNNNNSNSETRSHNETNTKSTTQQDAYEAGHVQGWKDPAKKIYEEVLKACSLLRNSKNTNANSNNDNNNNDTPHEKLQTATPSDSTTTTTPIDLNEFYDRIIFTGHSRGGLLAYYAGIVCARGINSNSNLNSHTATATATATATPPFRGEMGVVGFGIPPPPSPPTDPFEINFCARSFVSVVHHNDPVSNGSILVCRGWKPASTLSLGSTPEEQHERARKKELKLKLQQEARATAAKAKASSIRGGSGFWGALGNIVQTAVSAVGDSATELATNIEEHHSIEEYLRGVGSGRGVIGTGIGSASVDAATPDRVGATSVAGNITSSAEAIEPRMAFVVEKRTPEKQWVLTFQ